MHFGLVNKSYREFIYFKKVKHSHRNKGAFLIPLTSFLSKSCLKNIYSIETYIILRTVNRTLKLHYEYFKKYNI